jgi:type I restriction enzyme S subunit
MVSENELKSEDGIVFPEWEEKKLGEVTNIIMGQSPNSFNYNMKKIGLPLIQGNADCKNRKTQPKTFTSQITKECDIGDIIMSVRAPVGSISMSIHNACIGRGVCCIKHNNEKSQAFLYQILVYYERLWISISQGSTFESVNRNDIYTFPLNIPKSIKEQEKIAQVLSDMDDLIYKTEEIIEKQNAISQGVLNHLLKPKSNWDKKELKDICEIKRGELITKERSVNGNIPVIAGGKKPAYYHNQANRLGSTITISASGANAGYIAFHQIPIFASDCSTISESNHYDIRFIYYWLKLNQSKIYKMQTGGAQPHIHPIDLEPITIYVPSKSQQIEISEVLYNMDKEIEHQESTLQKLKNQKQGLMQTLLTGKIRLK